MHRSNSARVLHRIAVLILLTGLVACQGNEQQNVVNMDVPFEKEGRLQFLSPDDSVITAIDIEIADTPESRQQGLMYRRNLRMDQGMLFIFPQASTGGFWMKNTYIPLDIIFVGPDSQVVSIARNTRIMSEETVDPKGPKQFVVEVPAGFADRFDIDSSTRIRWDRTTAEDYSVLQKLIRGFRSLFGT